MLSQEAASSRCFLPPISVKVGESFAIYLDDHPTNDLSVCLSAMPRHIVLESVEKLSRVNDDAQTSVSAIRRFSFIATEPGTGELIFNKVKFSRPRLTMKSSTFMEKRFVIVKF